MKEQTLRWVEAGITLAKDPKAVIMCPACRNGPLEVSDQALSDQKTERHMRCSLCGAYNSVLLTADADSRTKSNGTGSTG